jgi:hypothetical protein
MLNNRLLTKNNLTRRGMVPTVSMACLGGGCGVNENINHLVVGCVVAKVLLV